MKILQIDGAPAFGGRARYVYGLSAGMRNRGHEVFVSCNHEKVYKNLLAADIFVIHAHYRKYPGIPIITAEVWRQQRVVSH